MSRSDDAADFSDLASEVAARCAQAIENNELSSIPNDALGQIIGSAIRLYAAKAQAGPAPYPIGRNSGVTETDVMIGCTALLDSLALNAFELGMWLDMSGIGKIDPEEKKRSRGG